MTGRRSHGRLSALNGVVHQGTAAPGAGTERHGNGHHRETHQHQLKTGAGKRMPPNSRYATTSVTTMLNACAPRKA